MRAKRGRKRKKEKPPVSLGGMAKENLPYPIVYYPSHYGTFFAFAKDESSPAALCLCSKPAIENLIRLKQRYSSLTSNNPLRAPIFDSFFFPQVIVDKEIEDKDNPLNSLLFVEGLCHRCNLITPSLRYCHEMYGVEFIQHFGWYYNQTYLRLGIYPGSYYYLEDVSPLEYQIDIKKAKKVKEEYQQEYERILKQVYGPKRDDIASDEIVYTHNVKIEEAQEMIRLRKLAAQTERAFTKKIENITRQELGFRNVGEGWVSETILYQIIQKIFGNKEILRHYRPEWLEGLELDIYIPSLKTAFEYQGQQHFHPINIWGGSNGLKAQQYRDGLKVMLCSKLGINLITIKYTEPLTEDYVRRMLEFDERK